MPYHQQVTTCRKSGGPVSKYCTCEHCTLSVCSVCGCGEGSLTTDCPGTLVDFDKQHEVYETNLDYTDERGWHQRDPMKLRSCFFEPTLLSPEPSRDDPRATVAPAIDWTRVDRTAHLQHELTLKGIAWVLADRTAEDHSVTLTRLEDEVDAQKGRDPNAHTHELRAQLEHGQIDFRLASQRAEKCDDEFRQAARKLVAVLEGAPPVVLPMIPKKDPAE